MRAQTQIELTEKVRGYQKKIASQEKDAMHAKTLLRIAMGKVNEAISDLLEEEMTDARFWGLAALNDDGDFDYGRDVLKEGVYESKMDLPYD